MRIPEMEEVIGQTWKGDLSPWSIEVEVSLSGELGVLCTQESCTQSGVSSQATKLQSSCNWLADKILI